VVVRGEVSPRPGRPGEHLRSTPCVGGHKVSSGVIGLFRANPSGRDIDVDVLATELVIDRCLTHG
jgi:hypothetical protein